MTEQREKIVEKVVKGIIAQEPVSEKSFLLWNRRLSGTFKIPPIPKGELAAVYHTLLKRQEVAASGAFHKFLRFRSVRTLSGVAPVTVLTKPYACPGKCVYCPTEPNMPKSYLSNEPAAMRAVQNSFDPYRQVHNRLTSYQHNQHVPEKIELLVLGGTWSAYPWDYQQWFIKRCFEAANYFPYTSLGKKIPAAVRSFTLQQAQKINERARYRIIGVTLETRPDWITDEEIKRLRCLGCTRVQLGAQILDDQVLDLIKRGHHVSHLITATRKLKENCFKIDYHLMQNLPGATVEKDIFSAEETFRNPDFRPDQIKVYPTIVNEYAELYDWLLAGRYQPYAQEHLVELLIRLKTIVPYYCRINRLIRDIPSESVIAGNKVTNLREMLQREMKQRQLVCRCIRCREVRGNIMTMLEPKMFIDEYEASGGKEYFLSYESDDRRQLFAFTRLRMNGSKPHLIFRELRNAGLIRELHTYGVLTGLKQRNERGIQHRGLGQKLMLAAEKIARQNGAETMAVIAGTGAKQYYAQKLGYRDSGHYMVKSLLKNGKKPIIKANH